MKRSVALTLFLLLFLAAAPVQGAAVAQGSTKVTVTSLYTLDRYGYATVNETVAYVNNSTSPALAPSLQLGLGDLSSKAVACSTYESRAWQQCPGGAGGPYSVSPSGSIPAHGNLTVEVSVLLGDVVSTAKNGTLEVLTLSSPSLSTGVDRLINKVRMPVSTSFKSSPSGLTASITGSNNTYYSVMTGVTALAAVTSVRTIARSAVQDFNPLHVFFVQRTLTTGPNGYPLVTDKLEFENLGTTALAQLHVSLLAPPTTRVTIVTATANEPILVNPFTVVLSQGAIDLTSFAVGYPSNGVQAGTNFTLTYQYPLGSGYYSVSGGQVNMDIPETAPVMAFVDSYTIGMSLPQGARAVQGSATSLGAVTPWQTGSASFAYSLSIGWAIDGGVPLASLVFILLLVGLFAARARTTTAEGEETEEEEEESSSEQAASMINAFDEKTNLINSLWQEIDGKDPNEVDKAYFEELRGRLDQFRSRALQRLNEVKQKAASQKFSEVVTKIQATEREVDRAAKDKLNLYQQYYLRQMKKEVYDRLLPQYSKRLERALNQLSDELHTVQRESKAL